MLEQFKVGDIVKLKSGGPDMTVTDLNVDNKHIECVYFYTNICNLIKDYFVPGALELVKTKGE